MDDTLLLKEIRRIYDDYSSDVLRLQSESKWGDGLLGFGKRPDQDPCHERFSERLEKVIEETASKQHCSGDILEALNYIYETPQGYKDNALVYWMMIAVQAFTEKLIIMLSPEDAAVLSERFKELYPKAVRLPNQKKIAAQLQERIGKKA